MIIGIDSNTLIYAGLAPRVDAKDEDDPDEELKQLQKSAKIVLFLHQEDTIILPAIAVSEVLTPIPEERKGALVSTLTEMFVCPPFDLRAAVVASRLRAEQKKLPAKERYTKRERHVLKADAMIVASVVVAGATRFYTSDKKCRKMASLIIDAPELPKSIPDNLYSDEILGDL